MEVNIKFEATSDMRRHLEAFFSKGLTRLWQPRGPEAPKKETGLVDSMGGPPLYNYMISRAETEPITTYCMIFTADCNFSRSDRTLMRR
jgi:hypothetical protein